MVHSPKNDLKMQHRNNHAIKKEERAKHGDTLSTAQKEHYKIQDKKPADEVYKSIVHRRACFDFIGIYLMPHIRNQFSPLQSE